VIAKRAFTQHYEFQKTLAKKAHIDAV